jgi:hypothetical protein
MGAETAEMFIARDPASVTYCVTLAWRAGVSNRAAAGVF